MQSKTAPKQPPTFQQWLCQQLANLEPMPDVHAMPVGDNVLFTFKIPSVVLFVYQKQYIERKRKGEL